MENLWQVFGESRARHDTISARDLRAFEQFSLNVREEGNDRNGTQMFIGFQLSRESKGIGALGVKVEDEKVGRDGAGGFEQFICIARELDCHAYMLCRRANLGGEEDVVNSGYNSASHL